MDIQTSSTEASKNLLADLEIKASPDILDEDSFATLWNVASTTVGGDYGQTRDLASKLLGFLCKHRFPYIVASNTDMQYLDDWFERDPKLLYDWTPESEMVDVVAQHANVPFDALTKFLENYGFKMTVKYSAKRSDRVEWFNSDWNVG